MWDTTFCPMTAEMHCGCVGASVREFREIFHLSRFKVNKVEQMRQMAKRYCLLDYSTRKADPAKQSNICNGDSNIKTFDVYNQCKNTSVISKITGGKDFNI